MNYKEFFDTLPAWDGENRITKLQQLVKVKATHLPPRGRKNNETDWFNFLVKQIIAYGSANGVVAGDKARELITHLCPFVEEPMLGLFVCGEGYISTADVILLREVPHLSRQKWLMTIEVEEINEDYKSLDIRQLYAQVLKRQKKQNSHDSRI